MELHTPSVDGGYTLKDLIEVACCLTRLAPDAGRTVSTPFEMIIDARRAVNADVENAFSLANQTAQLG